MPQDARKPGPKLEERREGRGQKDPEGPQLRRPTPPVACRVVFVFSFFFHTATWAQLTRPLCPETTQLGTALRTGKKQS